MDAPLVSIIIPVKNEEKLVGKCLESIKRLDYPQDKIEVIVVDGLSTDNTTAIAESYGAQVISNPKGTVSPGRNIGFAHSSGQIIAFTDADCIFDIKWIKNAIKYFADDSIGGVGGPNYTPGDDSIFGKAVSYVLLSGSVMSGSVQSVEDTIKKQKEVESLPGCNAIYRREALEDVMPVREDLLTCDDTELNRRILDRGYKLFYTPDTIVYHFRRDNPMKFFKQMYRYAIGRVQAGRRDKRLIKPVHKLAAFFLPLIVVIFLLQLDLSLYFLLAVLLVWSFFTVLSRSLLLGTNILFAFILFAIAWTCGYWREILFPMRDVAGK